MTQEQLDRWLPTIARYLGLTTVVILIPWVALGHWEALPGFVPAAGLLSYRFVKDAARDRDRL